MFGGIIAVTQVSSAQDQSPAAANTVSCPSVADRLPNIPDRARDEVERNLALLETQIQEANGRLSTSQGEGGPNFVNNAILGPLAGKRTATIDRIEIAFSRVGDRPGGLGDLATCTVAAGQTNNQGDNNQGDNNQDDNNQDDNNQDDNNQDDNNQDDNNQDDNNQDDNNQDDNNQDSNNQDEGDDVILANNCDNSNLEPHDGFQNGNRCVSTAFGEVGNRDRNPTLLIIESPEQVGVDQPFSFQVSTRNLVRDRFLPAAQGGYYVESALLNDEGVPRGHFHSACRLLARQDEAPNPDAVPEFFAATEDFRGGAEPDTVNIQVAGLPTAGTYQCSSWAGDGSHRIPMMVAANQTPAFDSFRLQVG